MYYLFIYHDVMASVNQNGRRRFVPSLKLTQLGRHLHICIRNIDRRLPEAMVALGPIFVYVAPVIRSQSAVQDIAELLLVL